ncbi:helix-turn-helix domain-containing protein [Sphingobacterium sp. Mn56C]|uniref:AraC family transcriptional regulator n=1 Tax=Sphingobacterium sp. Mn56C TaxID=3395261 RepID=UPI003BD644D0
MGKALIHTLPFTDNKAISTLVESRRAYTLNDMELNIFETYKASVGVPLQFQDTVLINMLQGKKIMHLKQVDAFVYLPGETLILPADAPLQIDFPEASLAAPTQCTALTIRRDKIEKVVQFLNDKYPKYQVAEGWKLDFNLFYLFNTPEIAALLDKLFQLILSTNALKDVLVDLAFKELIIRLLQSQSLLALDLSKNTNAAVLDFLKTFVNRHIAEPITLDLLALKANMSKSTLTRLFKCELGLSPMEYVIRQRLALARQYLAQTRSVKEACFAAGFNDVNYFVRLFKKKLGITPGAFIMGL